MLRVRVAVADDRLKYDNGEPVGVFCSILLDDGMVAEEGERERSKRKRRADSSFY